MPSPESSSGVKQYKEKRNVSREKVNFYIFHEWLFMINKSIIKHSQNKNEQLDTVLPYNHNLLMDYDY